MRYSSTHLVIWAVGLLGQHWDLTEQIFDKTLVLTSKRINGKEQIAGNVHFLIKKIDFAKFFGLKTIWKESIKVQVSDPHKTIIDIFDDSSLTGGIRSVVDILQKYLKSEYFNSSLLLEYAFKMKNKTVFKRLGFLLSIIKFEDTALIDQCQQNISRGNSQIDPSLKGKRLIKKWGLWIPDHFKNTLQQENK